MAVIKLTKKDELDELVARLTLQTGKKPTQQDVLDAAVELADEHFDELKEKLNPASILDAKKMQRILELREKLATIDWITPQREDFPSEEDADIYSF